MPGQPESAIKEVTKSNKCLDMEGKVIGTELWEQEKKFFTLSRSYTT